MSFEFRHNLIWLQFEDKAEETAAGHTVLVSSLIGWQLWKEIFPAVLFSAAVLLTVLLLDPLVIISSVHIIKI